MKTIVHANHIVVVRDKHADLIDPLTGRWQRFTTPRAAKWSATVYSRLRHGFGERVPNDTDVKNYFTPPKAQHVTLNKSNADQPVCVLLDR